MSDSFVSQLVVSADHPSLAGHFPGTPIVPGVVLLDKVLSAIQTHRCCTLQSIPGMKFLQPVLPGEPIALRVQFAADASTLRARFQGVRHEAIVFEGTFILSTATSAAP